MGLLGWSLAAQALLWAFSAAAAVGFLYSSQDQWYVLARTRFLPVFIRIQLGMLCYYFAVAVVMAVWLWLLRTAWLRYWPPRRRWIVSAGMLGVWLWIFGTVMVHAVAFHFGNYWAVTNFLADKFGLVIRYSDLAPARWPVRISVWLLGVATIAAGLSLVVERLRQGRQHLVPRRAIWVAPMLIVPAAVVAFFCSGRSAATVTPVPTAHRPGLPNVIILASDSLRADHLGCYGYKERTGRETSPNIDSLAAEGVVLENLLSATGSTTDSWFSMLSGRWPHEHGIRCVFPTRAMAQAAGRVPTIIRTANAHGYRTVVLGDWAACSFDSVDHGFQVCRVDPDMTFPDYIGRVTQKTHLWISAALMNPVCKRLNLSVGGDLNRNTYQDILAMLEGELARSARTGQPLCLLAFLSITHMPYRVYDGFAVRFGDPNYRGPHERAMDLSINELFTRGASEKVRAYRQRILDLYDTTVWIFDYVVGKAVQQLRARGMLDNSVLIITSDHGEDFLDPHVDSSHGKYVEAGLQSFRLPMIVRWPGHLHPHRVAHRLRGIDVGPTLLDLLGLPPLPGASGRSFLAHLKASADEQLAAIPDDRTCFFETGFLWDCPLTYPPDGPHRGYPVMSEVVQPDPGWNYRMAIPEEFYPTVMRAKDRAILRGDWKLVYVATRGRPTLRLYNVKADPNCLRPVAFDRGPFEQLARDLHAWITADPHPEFYLYEGMTRREFDNLFARQ